MKKHIVPLSVLIIFLGIFLFINRFLVLSHPYTLITFGKFKDNTSDVYVIYSAATTEAARINTAKKAAYRFYRNYLKSPVSVYLSPFKECKGIFIAKVIDHCVGGLCLSSDVRSSSIILSEKERHYLERYYYFGKKFRTFSRSVISPLLSKEFADLEKKRIDNHLFKNLIFDERFLDNTFVKGDKESIFKNN